MGILRTLTCTPGESVVREATTFTTEVSFDNGFSHLFNRTQRPLYKFDVRLGPLTRAEAESLSAFHAFHQGGKSFLWDGGMYGAVANPQLAGEGDGSRRDFFLANRYIGAGSLTVYSKNQATAVTSTWAVSSANGWPYSLSAVIGLVTFANSTNTIVASGHDFYAAYGCQYRCVFEPGGIKIDNFTKGPLFRADLKFMEVPLVN
jgi:hypothetical protein